MAKIDQSTILIVLEIRMSNYSVFLIPIIALDTITL